MIEVRGLELSDKNNKFVTKHFSGATTGNMKSYIQPTISKTPDFNVLHCSTNDLSFVKNECDKRNICFINNSNVNPTYHCDQGGIHLNKSGTNKLIENLLLDC